MKYLKKCSFFIISIILCCNFLLLKGKASENLEGQIIDGSLLTSDSSAFDEKPLIPISPFDEDISLYGDYLSNGISGITDRGNAIVYVSGQTNCYRTSDKVQVHLYPEKLTNSGWATVQTHSNVAYNTYKVDAGISYSVSRGYYYRVRGSHTAKKGMVIESCTTCTSAIYIS